MIESILTRPMNMTTIITNLLTELKSAVIPTLSPTVLYAEKHSKAIPSKSFSLSKIDMMMIPVPITIKEREITANALRTEISAISLR